MIFISTKKTAYETISCVLAKDLPHSQIGNYAYDSNSSLSTRWLGSNNEQALFDRVTSWNAQPNRRFEVFMGEFGVYSQYSAPQLQKARTAFIAREAEKRNISWTYWEYSSGFGAYDAETAK